MQVRTMDETGQIHNMENKSKTDKVPGENASNKKWKHVSIIQENTNELISFLKSPPVYKMNSHKVVHRINNGSAI
jgi:hypothetical protein